MTRRAMFALLIATVPLIGLTQLDAQPATNASRNMSDAPTNGSAVSAMMANDSTDADVPASAARDMATNSTDDAPPNW